MDKMSDIAIQVRKALEDKIVRGFLISLGFTEGKTSTASIDGALDAHAKLLSERFYYIGNHIIHKEDTSTPEDFKLCYCTLTDVYEPNKRKISLVRERTYDPDDIKEDAKKTPIAILETLRFIKKGIAASLTYSPVSMRVEPVVDSSNDDLGLAIDNAISRLPRDVTIQQKLSLVYQQLLAYIPPDQQNGRK